MIPTWKTEEKDKKLKIMGKNGSKMAQNSAILPPEKPRNPTL